MILQGSSGMARKSKAQLLKLLVLTVGVADVLGIYVAQHRLSQPVVDKGADESFVLATTPSPIGESDQKAVPAKVDNFAVTEPKVETPKRPSPEELAQIDLPLPPMSSDIGAARHSSGKRSSHELAAIGLPLPALHTDSAEGRRASRSMSVRERAQSDLPEMASTPRGIRNPDVAARPVVVPTVRLPSKSIGRHEFERQVIYQAGLALPEGHFVSHARSPGAKVAATHPHSRLVAASHHMANAAAANTAHLKDQSFSAAFADGVEKTELPDVAYGQQGELPLVQPDADNSSPAVAGSSGVSLSVEQGIDRPASDRPTAAPQPTLKDPFPAADTVSSPPKL